MAAVRAAIAVTRVSLISGTQSRRAKLVKASSGLPPDLMAQRSCSSLPIGRLQRKSALAPVQRR
jgi:hypothetical protein